MMNKGVTATVSVDSDAVCCTLLLRSDTATVSVDSDAVCCTLLLRSGDATVSVDSGGMLNPVVDCSDG